MKNPSWNNESVNFGTEDSCENWRNCKSEKEMETTHFYTPDINNQKDASTGIVQRHAVAWSPIRKTSNYE